MPTDPDILSSQRYTPLVQFDWDITESQLRPIQKLITNDTGTDGNWWRPDAVTGNTVWQYGTRGYMLPGGPTSVPGFAGAVSTGAASVFDYGTLAGAPRLPPTSAGFSNKVFRGTNVTFTFPGSDGVIGLYLADPGDTGGRSTQVIMRRTSTGNTIYNDTVTYGSGGRWLRWAVTEPVTIQLAAAGGTNFNLAGIFFDDYPGTKRAAYCRYPEDIVMGGQLFKSEMRLQVDPGQTHGGVEDKPWTVTMPLRSPMDTLVLPYAHSTVFVKVWECDPRNPNGTKSFIWQGKVSKTIKNQAGFRKLVKAEVSGWKSLIQYPIGMQSNPQCNWNFGDTNCKYPARELQETLTISDVTDGTVIHLQSPPNMTKHWRMGSIELDGLGVTIVAQLGPSGFRWMVSDPIPSSWIGRAAIWTPGCDKTPLVCNKYYSNIVRIGCFGVAIPDWNPILGAKT